MPEPTLSKFPTSRHTTSDQFYSAYRAPSSGEVVSLMGAKGHGHDYDCALGYGAPAGRRRNPSFRAWKITFDAAYRVAKLGIGIVPPRVGRCSNITTRENLIATAAIGAAPPMPGAGQVCACLLAWRAPELGNSLRRGAAELAHSRALMTNPRLLILDEGQRGWRRLIRARFGQCLSRRQDRWTINPAHRQERRAD